MHKANSLTLQKSPKPQKRKHSPASPSSPNNPSWPATSSPPRCCGFPSIPRKPTAPLQTNEIKTPRGLVRLGWIPSGHGLTEASAWAQQPRRPTSSQSFPGEQSNTKISIMETR